MRAELFNVEIKNTHGKATKVVNDRQGKTIFGGKYKIEIYYGLDETNWVSSNDALRRIYKNCKFIDPQEEILLMGCGHESHTEMNDCFFKYLGSPAD